ncbi:MAG: translocation/assembly module TamB domain-containing protein [Candidatus Binatia bacterium]|nr:translocation/assembly module TamB domain-containing protein [Candidatus Binatia bacterium]
MSWLFVAVVTVVVAVGLAIALVLIVLPMPATREWVRGELETVLSSALDDEVRITAVPSLWPTWITLQGVSIGGDDAVVRAESLTLELRIPSLTPPRLRVDVVLVQPDLDLVREADGRWNVEKWAGPDESPEPADGGLGIPRWLGRVGLELRDGRIRLAGMSPEPLRLSSLSVSGRLWVGVVRDSVVEVDALSVALGDASRLGLHGTYELEGEQRLHAVLKVDPLVGADLAGLVPELRDDARVAGTVEAEGAVDYPKLALDLTSGDARLVGHGALESENGDQAITVSFDATEIDVAAFVHGAPAGEVTAKMDTSASLRGDEVQRIEGQLTVTKSRLFDVEVENLSVHATTTDGDVDLKVDAATPDNGVRTSLRGSVQLAAPHRARASGDVELNDPAALSEALGTYLSASNLKATITAEVDDPTTDSPTGMLDLKFAPGRLRGVPVDGGELSARLRPDLVSLERLWIGADRTNLEGHAWAQLQGPPDQRAVGGEIRGPLSLALFTNAYGVVETDLKFWGHLEDLGLSALVQTSGPVELPGLEGTFSSRIEATELGGTGGKADLELTGLFAPDASVSRIFGRDDRQTTVRASWARVPTGDTAGPPLDRVEFDARMGDAAKSGGSFQAVVQRRGDQAHVEVPGLEIRPVVGPAWRLVSPAKVDVTADGVAVQDVRVEVGGGRIEAQGHVAGEAGPRNDLAVRVNDIDLALLCELLVVGDECSGKLGASLDVQGSAARPNVIFDLGIDELAASGQDYGTLRASARTEGSGLAIAARIEGGDAGTLDLNGQLPLEAGGRAPAVSMNQPARVQLRATDLQIDVFRALAGRAVRRLDGRATAQVDLRGPLADPRLDGSLTIEDLTFSAAAIGATHRHGRVRLSIDSKRFKLEELTLDEGAITAGGEVRLAGGFPTAFDLWLALDGAEVVSRSEADATASGRVALTGPVDAPHLEGDVTIDRATIRPTIAPGGGKPEPDPSVVVVRRYGSEPAWTSGVPPSLGGEAESRPVRSPLADPRAKAGMPNLYEDLTMIVAVRLGGPVVVRRYDANMRLSGEVYLTKKPDDELRISGGIGGRQGWYIFQGRRFEIRSAYVTFSGETPLDPYLDVSAQYRTGDYLVRIRIAGTAKHPSLDLSSDPALDQSDILSVVLFGKPASQLSDSQGQVLQSQAFALLASYVAPALQRSVLDTLGLTSLTFSMPTGDTAGTIGVGRYIGEDLFISVARDFGGPSGGTSRQLQGLVGSSVTIQYYLTPSVTLQGASSTEGESSVDVIWHRRY